MITIKFLSVFSNDVNLHSEVLRELYNIFGAETENGMDVIRGTAKFQITISGTMTTAITHSNTVCGYEPTETQEFQLHIKAGDVVEWSEGNAEMFEHLYIQRD